MDRVTLSGDAPVEALEQAVANAGYDASALDAGAHHHGEPEKLSTSGLALLVMAVVLTLPLILPMFLGWFGVQAMVLLLALSAAYPEIMRRLLLELECSCRYCTAATEGEEVATVLGATILQWSEKEGVSANWDKVDCLIQDPELLDPSLLLSEIGLSNVQLVRSFSFVGEVDAPPDPKTAAHDSR